MNLILYARAGVEVSFAAQGRLTFFCTSPTKFSQPPSLGTRGGGGCILNDHSCILSAIRGAYAIMNAAALGELTCEQTITTRD